MRILLFAAFVSAALSVPAFADDISALLHRQTQEFSDAGQQGKGSAMAKYLDDDVIFFNESGDKAVKADMTQDGPAAPGDGRTITTTDWDCKVHGDVAVTSFIDVVEQGPATQRQQTKFRSVETWLREGQSWKMIGSETLTLLQDPDAVTLDGNTLDEYAGTYEASPEMKLTFAHKGGDLVASLNGGAETVQKAQARDIFFTPGRGSTPKIFQRADNGKITGFVYLRGNSSLTFKRIA
jgi:ketosteroid isomerase-like protein